MESAPGKEADLLRCLVELRWYSTKSIATIYKYLDGWYPLWNAGVSVSTFPLCYVLRVSPQPVSLNSNEWIVGFLNTNPTLSVLPVESMLR